LRPGGYGGAQDGRSAGHVLDATPGDSATAGPAQDFATYSSRSRQQAERGWLAPTGDRDGERDTV